MIAAMKDVLSRILIALLVLTLVSGTGAGHCMAMPAPATANCDPASAVHHALHDASAHSHHRQSDANAPLSDHSAPNVASCCALCAVWGVTAESRPLRLHASQLFFAASDEKPSPFTVIVDPGVPKQAV